MSYIGESYWLTSRKWVCTNHLPTLKLNAHIEECYLCGAKKPKEFKPRIVDDVIDFSGDIESVIINGKRLCRYVKCKKGNNKTRAFANGNSKYCSAACRKQRARDTYNQKKALKNGNTQKNSKGNTW